MKNKKKLTEEAENELLQLLEKRFNDNMHRHKEMKWDKVLKKLRADKSRIWSLYRMEQTGGEPDIIAYSNRTFQYLFADCSPESPEGRRSLCYDEQALNERRENKPAGSAEGMAAEMNVLLMNEKEYRLLQQTGRFDTKTSSWLKTPANIRNNGGALFGDFRYGQVFIYHNGAQSYYAARGFRSVLWL